MRPADFGRLRVETSSRFDRISVCYPAAFGRLRVETDSAGREKSPHYPAAFGRLRVETCLARGVPLDPRPAAFGRLRVETPMPTTTTVPMRQPPSGGCVLKPIAKLAAATAPSSRLRAAAC